VTFTRKAASELKIRFILQLEEALEEAFNDGDGERADRLRDGIENAGRCFVGTIHSFCARLLRERPVEAGVDPAFTEMDEDDDERLRRFLWEEQMSGLDGSEELDRILAAGLSPNELFGLFETVAGQPDVDSWPAPAPALPDMTPALGALKKYMAHLDMLLPQLPSETGSDSLIPKMQRVRRMARNASDISDPLTLFTILETFALKVKPVQRNFPEGKEQALGEAEKWEKFNSEVAAPAAAAFMEYRYAVALETVLPAVARYRQIRTLQGSLNYGDLLLKAADLLKDSPEVRRFFQDRYRYLLVDEFQDTDPVQAEVMMYLTAVDDSEKDWRKCVPRPGSLFVVGDPKQSIYRFRRADIAIYNEVKGIITGPGPATDHSGEKIELTSNFRSRPEILSWVNEVFEPHFPDEETSEAPQYVPLSPGRETPEAAGLAGIRTVTLPAACTSREKIAQVEPERIARTIRHLVDSGATINGKDGSARPCAWGDFLVVTMKKEDLTPFSRAFDRWSIPHQVTGGTALGEAPELRDLYVAVKSAARPHDPVAFVAALRSEMFGFSDAELLAIRLAGSRFRWNAPVPDGLDEELAERLSDVKERFSLCARWLATLPVVAALERITESLGLPAKAALSTDGDLRAGSLFKALEILREAAAQRPTLDHILGTLEDLLTGEEAHDGMGALPRPVSVVRVMNLHKVKGLEAPVVFLAAPAGQWNTTASLHIERSGSEVHGYAEVQGAGTAFGRGPTVAHPVEWMESWAPKEEAFLEAELVRLRYVAATRAGSMLVITRAPKADAHPWGFFYKHLDDAPELEDPEDLVPPVAVEVEIGPDEAGDPAVYKHLWEDLLKPGYGKLFPSRLAASGKDPQPPTGEHGTAWGTVIHRLLDAAMGAEIAEQELEELAAVYLADEELSKDEAPRAAATVRSVIASDTWKRAQAASQMFTEIPYTRTYIKEGMDTIETGVMDLVFEEDGGWVIVDYKTGSKDSEKYKPQLTAYREAWSSFKVGEVKEVGILWVDEETYEPF
jgi:ATP-dependent helicase/nuclease subunit A